MKIIGIIFGSLLTAIFLFMIWRLIDTYLPPSKKDPSDKKDAKGKQNKNPS